ncbi:hypothetical protein N7530_008652 [Penicillium desertorum]|uniref:Uncharacterized protein n=1 Tax=Penicillium desertorum TaxID=1303715 RepID=A0A9W9WPH5_9EURO|nr:hypothetical protein N7530_008652 [Penicillium desertorum]
MVVYNIHLVNENRDNYFSIMMDPPEFSNNNEVFSNAWISTFIPSGGNFGFATDDEFFAWVGTVPQLPAPGVEIPSGVGRLASLGTNTSFEMKTTINDAATLMESTHGAPPASFEIFTGNDLPSPNGRYLLGVAKMDDHRHLIPVATVLASNERTTQIKPKMKFYISRAEYPAGFIVDFKPASSCAGIIDFNSSEGQDKNIAIVRYTKNGGFQVDYHGQPLMAQGKELLGQGLQKLHHLIN